MNEMLKELLIHGMVLVQGVFIGMAIILMNLGRITNFLINKYPNKLS